MVLLQRKLYFSKDPEGSNIFQGVQMLISIETHVPCDFPRGGGGGGGGKLFHGSWQKIHLNFHIQ